MKLTTIKKINFCIFCILALSVVFSCNGKKKSSKITIDKITARTISGQILGSFDPTDWVEEYDWHPCVEPNFNFTDTFDYSVLADTASLSVMVYPNPSSRYFYFGLFVTNDAILKFIIVDELCNKLLQHTVSLKDGNNQVQIDTEGILQSDKYYRVYYLLLNKNKKIIVRGHGDLLKL